MKKMSMDRKVGLTKAAGWEMGIRKTFEIDPLEAWSTLFSEEGISVWLGNLKGEPLEVGQDYKTTTDITGKVKVLKQNSHVRLTWKKKDWDNVSTLQLRIIGANKKTVVSFHQENLADEAQREEMLARFSKILDKIGELFV
jgi:activator of HSP90 ATPase